MSASIHLSLSTAVVLALVILALSGLSRLLKLGMETSIVIAFVRAALQLTCVGLILQVIWTHPDEAWAAPASALLIVLMTTAGAQALRTRLRAPELRKRFSWGLALEVLTVQAVLGLVLTQLLWRPIQPEGMQSNPTAVLIPFMGLILGNSISGLSLALERLFSALSQGPQSARVRIESDLCNGASIHEALHPYVREAFATGLHPILNSMTAAGLVSIPGAMSGQLLAGGEPMQAVLTQGVILVSILVASSLGMGLGLWLLVKRTWNLSSVALESFAEELHVAVHLR